jgi:ComF family protein
MRIQFQMFYAKAVEACSHVWKLVIAVTAPPVCAYCKTFLLHRTILCDGCKRRIRSVVSHELVITSAYSVYVFAISDYKDPIRALILAKGYYNLTAARQLGILLWQLTDLQHQQFDYIIPVPLHWWRYAQRGYNQAAYIAYGIQSKSSIPVLHLLKRVKSTVRQSELSHDQRAENVQQAFVLCPDMYAQLRGKRILLVDDLMTTGATLRACVQELRKAHPAHITVGVASRVV